MNKLTEPIITYLHTHYPHIEVTDVARYRLKIVNPRWPSLNLTLDKEKLSNPTDTIIKELQKWCVTIKTGPLGKLLLMRDDGIKSYFSPTTVWEFLSGQWIASVPEETNMGYKFAIARVLRYKSPNNYGEDCSLYMDIGIPAPRRDKSPVYVKRKLSSKKLASFLDEVYYEGNLLCYRFGDYMIPPSLEAIKNKKELVDYIETYLLLHSLEDPSYFYDLAFQIEQLNTLIK